MITVVCTTLLFIGVLGLLISLLTGSHGHRPSHSHGHQHAHSGKGSARVGNFSLLLMLLSPIVLFSICLGAGASGLAALHFRLTLTLVTVCLLFGGPLFYAAIIRPLISTLMKFESKPSKALEGSVSEPAEVISHFDSSGRGLVKLIVDGQLIRVLATLEESDRPSASEIVPGDRLVVTKVDSHTNACTVARI